MSGTRPAAGTREVLHIDWTRCDGRGLCAELLPEILRRDDWGYPVGKGGSNVPVPPRLAEAAADAVALCPLAALSIRSGGRS